MGRPTILLGLGGWFCLDFPPLEQDRLSQHKEDLCGRRRRVTSIEEYGRHVNVGESQACPVSRHFRHALLFSSHRSRGEKRPRS